jgi:hypothetical protein
VKRTTSSNSKDLRNSPEDRRRTTAWLDYDVFIEKSHHPVFFIHAIAALTHGKATASDTLACRR